MFVIFVITLICTVILAVALVVAIFYLKSFYRSLLYKSRLEKIFGFIICLFLISILITGLIFVPSKIKEARNNAYQQIQALPVEENQEEF